MISLRAYAKRRGVSAMTISLAVKSGRLRNSVTRDENGQPKIADPELADREWEANSDYTDAPQRLPVAGVSPVVVTAQDALPTDDGTPTLRKGADLGESAAVEKYWKALKAEADYRERVGELVLKVEVARAMTDDYAEVRTKLLGVPSRVRQQDPTFTNDQIVLIETLVREALTALVPEE